jgi:shikimate kinase
MNIVLLGFSSCGKSATAYELSKRLSMKFVDFDKEIELRHYLSHGRELHYRDIIITEGPEYFFRLENQVLKEIEHLDDCVLAPGGGAPLRVENRDILKKLGPLVYLKTVPEVILERMQAKGIPLFLRDNPTIDNLRRIWQQRDQIYTSLANYTIVNSQLNISETADQVMKVLGLGTVS